MKFLVTAILASVMMIAPQSGSSQEAVKEPYLSGWTPMIGASIASQHFGAQRDFNETNPGVLIGFARQSTITSAEFGVEGGVFRNSFDDTSAIIGGWYEWPIAGEPDGALGQLRLGFAFGYAEYPELVDRADAFQALTIGDFVPFVTPQATWRITESFEVRSKFGPIFDGDADFVAGFQVFYRLPVD
ncbi:MAG: hypothetical protein ACPGGK_01630 [Pikeienuella sp.]